MVRDYSSMDLLRTIENGWKYGAAELNGPAAKDQAHDPHL
jgi:hypothetical protein